MASTPDPEPWWKEHPEQLADLLTRIRGRGWDVVGLTFDDANEAITLDVAGLPEPPGRLKVILPPGYPTVAAPIMGPDGLGEHIHPADGTLCLPAHLTDAEDLIEAAVHLYDVGEQGLGALRALGAGSAEPRTGFLPGGQRRAVSLGLPLSAGSWGTLTFHGTATPDVLKGTIVRSSNGDTGEKNAAPPTLLRNLDVAAGAASRNHEFPWWRTSNRAFPTSAPELFEFWRSGLPDAARKWVANYERARGGNGRPGRRGRRNVRLYGLVVPEEGPKHDEWHERLVVIALRGDKVTAFPAAEFAELNARVPDLGDLSDRKVAVAGIGMLGGNLAIDLARTGVGQLRFADHETVELGNLVRQPYELGDVGEPKVEALRRLVQRAAPTCEVPDRYLLRRRAGRSATRAELAEWLSGADLLVMTTGDHQGELHLCEVAQGLGVSVVSGWVSLGVWGSLALATEWGHTGCRWCLDQRHDELAQLAEPDGAEDLYTPGCGYPTFPGNVIDGRIAASIIGRMVIEQLRGRLLPGNLAVTTMQTPDGRTGPTTTYTTLPPDPGCPICTR